MYPQGVCRIRKSSSPTTAALYFKVFKRMHGGKRSAVPMSSHLSGDRQLEGPVTITEDRNNLAVTGGGIDIHGVAADHEVHMDHRFIDTQCPALFQRLVVVVTDGVGEALAHSQVAGGVLIEQGVIEQNAAFADGILPAEP